MSGMLSSIQIALITLWLTLSLSGCVATTSRYIANPTSPPQDSALQGVNGDVEVKLHYVIVPDGPGSWIRGAKWNEWVVSITNRGRSDVTVMRVSLIDQRGVHVGSEITSAYQAESQSEFLARRGAQGMGIYGVAMGSALIGGLTGIPVGLASVFMNDPAEMDAKDQDAIQAEFKRRTLPHSVQLTGGGSVSGSVFFSLVPQPQALIVGYWSGRGEQGQIKIPLDKTSTVSVPTPAAQKP